MARLGRSLVAALLALAATLGASQAEDPMHATLDRAVVLKANLTGHLMTDSPGPLRLYLSIVAFTVPRDRKPVEIVVSASAGGPGRELGRVAISPYVAFGVRNKSRRQEFAFLVPREFNDPTSLSITVALHPVNGGGAGASLDVGGASMR